MVATVTSWKNTKTLFSERSGALCKLWSSGYFTNTNWYNILTICVHFLVHWGNHLIWKVFIELLWRKLHADRRGSLSPGAKSHKHNKQIVLKEINGLCSLRRNACFSCVLFDEQGEISVTAFSLRESKIKQPNENAVEFLSGKSESISENIYRNVLVIILLKELV